MSQHQKNYVQPKNEPQLNKQHKEKNNMQRSQNMNQMEISGDDEHKNDSDHEY